MTTSMELGLLVRGGDIPRRIRSHYDKLIAVGSNVSVLIQRGAATPTKPCSRSAAADGLTMTNKRGAQQGVADLKAHLDRGGHTDPPPSVPPPYSSPAGTLAFAATGVPTLPVVT